MKKMFELACFIARFGFPIEFIFDSQKDFFTLCYTDYLGNNDDLVACLTKYDLKFKKTKKNLKTEIDKQETTQFYYTFLNNFSFEAINKGLLYSFFQKIEILLDFLEKECFGKYTFLGIFTNNKDIFHCYINFENCLNANVEARFVDKVKSLELLLTFEINRKEIVIYF